MEIKLNETSRGFIRGNFVDFYNVECNIQESSIAEPKCIWVGCSQPEPKQLIPGRGWVDFELPPESITNTRMHLNQEQAAALIPLLQRFVETGQLQ